MEGRKKEKGEEKQSKQNLSLVTSSFSAQLVLLVAFGPAALLGGRVGFLLPSAQLCFEWVPPRTNVVVPLNGDAGVCQWSPLLT